MVNVQATNEKLRQRARRIVSLATGSDEQQATAALSEAEGEVRVAVAMLLAGVTADEARRALAKCGGLVAGALEILRRPAAGPSG
ncbi:MAG: hypothetical protein N3A57_05670 [Negativicutes bacterium]|nr:hypothetical protein [Negativicutes bacterium]